ncbi:UNVERIFIED_ORG: hypothetical protein E4P37_19075 [Bacillus sp. AZ43]
MSAGLLTTFVFLALGASAVAAPSAAAIDDPTRPEARVTHGPSCRPGGLVVEVVAGTVPYAVRLATTRTPAGEDEAVLEPGQTVTLRTGDVDWGETIDGRLEFTARDGSGTAFTDELEEYSFTRPTREDCEAVARPTTPEPVPPASPETSAGPTATPDGSAPPATPSSSPTAGSSGPAPAPALPSGAPPVRQVSAGETVTLGAAGFLPGERVTVRLSEGGPVLTRATAAPDGSVEVDVRIPEGTSGPTTVELVGADSAVVAGVRLQVAGAGRSTAVDGWGDVVPLTAAAVALVGSVAALVSVGGTARVSGRRHAVSRSA